MYARKWFQPVKVELCTEHLLLLSELAGGGGGGERDVGKKGSVSWLESKHAVTVRAAAAAEARGGSGGFPCRNRGVARQN